jgi:lipid A ethanolaminephosphotransferase
MSLRLFHITEFAESRLLSPASQRNAVHPYVVVLLFSLWMASVCNLPLWQALLRLSDSDSGKVWWIGIGLALMMASALVMLLSLLTWHRVLKISLTLLLMLVALNAYFMLTQHVFIDASMIMRIVRNPGTQLRALLNWQFLLIVSLLGVLPAVVLWRMPLRRTPLMQNLAQNLAVFVGACLVLAGLWLYTHQTVASLISNQPQLRQLFNPFNTLQTPVQRLVSVRP